MLPAIVISANTSWNVYNFRKPLIRALQDEGYRVVAIAPPDESSELLVTELGCEYRPILIDSSGTSIKNDFALIRAYRKYLKELKATAFLGYTIKPNIYGSFAAHLTGTPTINNISGLGTVFIKKNWITPIVLGLYRLVLSRAAHVFFQNEDDRSLFVKEKLVKPEITGVLPGSGIDLDKYQSDSPVASGDIRRFLLMARLLWDKGVGEYVKAARRVKAENPDVIFQILGFLSVDNRTAVSSDDIANWQNEGLIEYLGSAKDVRPFIEAADCVVLPSYREGTPRSLLEAGAMSRPIITTDVPGCRQIVDDGQNGFLCEVRNSIDLAKKMKQFLALSVFEQQKLGQMSREKMVRQYDVEIVTAKYLTVIKAL